MYRWLPAIERELRRERVASPLQQAGWRMARTASLP